MSSTHLITSKELDVLRSYVTGLWPAGMSSGMFGDLRDGLKARGLIEARPDRVGQNQITAAGRELLASLSKKPEGSDHARS
jgi:hypothetical protein